MHQEQASQVLELGKGEVAGQHGRTALPPADAHPNVCGLNHAHVIGSIANACSNQAKVPCLQLGTNAVPATKRQMHAATGHRHGRAATPEGSQLLIAAARSVTCPYGCHCQFWQQQSTGLAAVLCIKDAVNSAVGACSRRALLRRCRADLSRDWCLCCSWLQLYQRCSSRPQRWQGWTVYMNSMTPCVSQTRSLLCWQAQMRLHSAQLSSLGAAITTKSLVREPIPCK